MIRTTVTRLRELLDHSPIAEVALIIVAMVGAMLLVECTGLIG